MCWMVAMANSGLAYMVMGRMRVPMDEREGCFHDICLPCLVRCARSHRPGKAVYSTVATTSLFRAVSRYMGHPSRNRGDRQLVGQHEAPETGTDTLDAQTAVKLVQRLPHRERLAVELKIMVGHPLRVAASEMGCSGTSVSNLCRSGLGRLRKWMGADEG